MMKGIVYFTPLYAVYYLGFLDCCSSLVVCCENSEDCCCGTGFMVVIKHPGLQSILRSCCLKMEFFLNFFMLSFITTWTNSAFSVFLVVSFFILELDSSALAGA